jgi:glycerol-3-phosphate dehydrogenase (NAD(P)+)
VLEIAEEYGVDMPIATEVVKVVHEGRPASEAYRGLLKREISLERG